MIVILGPTASGKTTLAVNLANEFNGEIISADSRQIYKGMDIGTGKDLKEYYINRKKINSYLIDILNPNINYSVYQFKKDFQEVYNIILSKNKIPFLCGGTGLYIESILLDYQMSITAPNIALRKALETCDIDQLIKKLKNIQKQAFSPDYHTSKRRIIRSIEILSNKNNATINMNKQGNNSSHDSLVIGLDVNRSIILQSIKSRLKSRLNEGMIAEVKTLLQSGVCQERLNYFGLEYKFIGKYLAQEIDYIEMVEKLNFAINRFSKRQMTFFRRMEKRGIKINWVKRNEYTKIKNLIKKYLKN